MESLDKEAAELRREIYRICWFMRGAITADEGFMLCSDDRSIIGSIIKENLETTKTSGLPFF